MKKVLIMGNGISRLTPECKKFIEEWDGEFWACNLAYIDFGDKITLLSGHSEVMHDAKKYRAENYLTYEIVGGHIDKDSWSDRGFSCDKIYWRDTGTTLIAEALYLRYIVYVVGFDLGGRDVYSPRQDTLTKSIWIKRWRKIIKDFGSDRLNFIGVDHLPYLTSGESEHKFTSVYRRGLPHIDDPEYKKIHAAWTKEVYNQYYKDIPHVSIKNVSQREYAFNGFTFGANVVKLIPEGHALKIRDAYPKDFVIIEEKKTNENL